MKIPEGYTEKQVLESIEIVVRGLAHKFKFGYFSIEDISQQIRIECIEALERYDSSKGKLDTFLWTNAKNRMSNLKRNKFERKDKPCLNCPLKAYDPQCHKSQNQCTEYEDKDDCKLYYNWIRRNTAKKNIMAPVGIQNVKDENESRMKDYNDPADAAYVSGVVNLIDEKIPVSLRSSWIKMKNEIRLPKKERENLLSAIREILAEENYQDD